MLGKLRKRQVVNVPLNYEETPVKQPGKVPEVRKYTKNAKEAILSFLQQHNDQLVTQQEIARGSGTAVSKVGKLVKELEDEGRIVRSNPIPRVGTRYFVQEGVQSVPDEVALTPQGSGEPQNVKLSQIIENLVWQYIRATRSTDILQFLTWMDEQKTGN